MVHAERGDFNGSEFDAVDDDYWSLSRKRITISFRWWKKKDMM